MTAPEAVRARVDGELVLFELHPRPLERLRYAFSLPNPKYSNHKRFGGRGENPEPRRIDSLIEMPDRSVHLPRGSVKIVKELLALDNYALQVTDDRRSLGAPTSICNWTDFKLETRDYQLEGVTKLRKATQGLISLPPGTGKTRLGTSLVLVSALTTLVLVPTGDIADQWLETLAKIGIVGGKLGDGKDQRYFDVVVGIVDSVDNLLRVDPSWGQRFGLVIGDEAHRVSAPTWQRVMRLLPGKYRLALTATPDRDDGLGPLVLWTFGDLLMSRTIREMIRYGYLMPATIEFVETGWEFKYDGPEKKKLSAMERELAEDLARNALIAERTVKRAKAGETCLVLVRTKAHTKELADMICQQGVEARALTSLTAKGKRKGTISDLRDGKLQVAVATSLANEGLDVQRLSYIALGSPQRARSATIQRLGRLLRLWEGKRPHLDDYVDSKVATLKSRASARERVFKETGLLDSEARS